MEQSPRNSKGDKILVTKSRTYSHSTTSKLVNYKVKEPYNPGSNLP